MSETLVIRLRTAEDAPASWVVVDTDGARLGPVQNGPLADAAADCAGRKVLLLVPGSEVMLAEPELPVRGGARLAQAVPFALEEQLASDIDLLHFAVGARGTRSGTPVAVVSRSNMDRWRNAWESAGIRPDACFADTTLVPLAPNGSTLLLDEGSLLVRRAEAMPFALEVEPLAAALELALADVEPGDRHVIFYANPGDYEAHRELIEGLRDRLDTLQVKLMPDGALPLLAAQALGAAPVNLAQGPYAPPSAIGNRLRAWRLPLSLAAAVLLAFVAQQGFAIWQLSRIEKQLDAEIAEVFSQALPGQPIVDARAQMEGLLGAGTRAPGTLLPAVAVLASAVAEVPNARIEALSFRGDALDLRLVAPSVEALDGIKQAIARNGVNAELQSATPRGEVVEGRLQLRLGAA
jgi:general secretion pathway protein L